MGIIDQLQRIASDMCDHYCRYREEANKDNKAHPEKSDEREDRLYRLHCARCPLVEFF